MKFECEKCLEFIEFEEVVVSIGHGGIIMFFHEDCYKK